MCVKLHSVCVKLHTVCEITQCAQNYTYSIGKNSSQLKNFTLTPWAAWATNISCVSQSTFILYSQFVLPLLVSWYLLSLLLHLSKLGAFIKMGFLILPTQSRHEKSVPENFIATGFPGFGSCFQFCLVFLLLKSSSRSH